MIGLDDASLEGRAPRPRFLVIQNGARHNYAIPAAFQRAGALSSVYTDLAATRGLGRMLSRVAPAGSNLAEVLRRRTPPTEIADSVFGDGPAFLAGKTVTPLLGSRAGYRCSAWLSQRRMGLRGMQGATHLYTSFGEGGSFIKKAREEGLGVVGDVYIALSADQIVTEEAAHYPDWADDVPKPTTLEQKIELNHNLLHFSDLLVCPSEFVRNDLIEHGIEMSRTLVVPYGVSSRLLSLEVDPEPGRILFAGTATLRKGIHYLAAAATLLKSRCRVRVAGAVSDKVRHHPLARDLEFLGQLGPNRMAEEFSRADIFAFPTLAEGAAGVTSEALGAGIPVVTTKAAGSIVRDCVDGIIVSERDPGALARAVLSIVEDREKRTSMSLAARQHALNVNWDGFAAAIIHDVAVNRL